MKCLEMSRMVELSRGGKLSRCGSQFVFSFHKLARKNESSDVTSKIVALCGGELTYKVAYIHTFYFKLLFTAIISLHIENLPSPLDAINRLQKSGIKRSKNVQHPSWWNKRSVENFAEPNQMCELYQIISAPTKLVLRYYDIFRLTAGITVGCIDGGQFS